MANPAPITLAQLFRYFVHLPHQMAAIAMLEEDIKTAGYAVAMRRDRPWFEVWSQDGKQTLKGLELSAQQPAQPIKVPAHFRLTRTGKLDSGGLELLSLRQVVDGIPMGELLVVSGAPGRQVFRKGRESRAQSIEPLPEGRYGIEDIEWKGGKDNYQGTWGPGLEPVWVGINYQAPGRTERSALGIHLNEKSGPNPGTAGCVGIRSVADLKRLVTMLRNHDPKQLLVDWGLGSCPPVRLG
jgi:lysozyme